MQLCDGGIQASFLLGKKASIGNSICPKTSHGLSAPETPEFGHCLGGDAVVEGRDQQLRRALEARDGELTDRDMQALAFSLEHQLLIEAGEDRLRNGRRLRIAAAGAGVLYTRAENDRIDDLDDAGRAGAVDDGLFAEAAAFAAEEGLCLAFAAESTSRFEKTARPVMVFGQLPVEDVSPSTR